MTVKVKVTGEEKLLRKLTIIPREARTEIYHAMADQADEIVEMMQRLVPVEFGDLRRSITWHWGPRGRKRPGTTELGELRAAQREDLTITIVAADNEAFYGRFIEFGTRHMAARPFFFVSWRANRRPARNRIRAAVRRAARRVAAR